MRVSKQRFLAWEQELEHILRTWAEELDEEELEEILEEENERKLRGALYGILPALISAFLVRNLTRPVASEVAVEGLSAGRAFRPGELRERAAQILESTATTLSRYLAGSSWEDLKDRLASWIREGLTPSEIAERLRMILPLTPRQAESLENWRQYLLAAGVPPAEVEKRIQELRDRYIAARAQSIAHTEFQRAWNLAKLETWRELAEEGYLPRERAMKVWRTLPGCCPDCAELEGSTVPLDDVFPEVGLDGPPLHPNCRCYLEHL